MYTRQLIKSVLFGIPFSISTFLAPSGAAENLNVDALDSCKVVWNSPSEDCNGTMPIGNGDLAANVWVEPNGDLLFYLSKSDTWSSGQELLKLGRVRVRLDKPFVREGLVFKQVLDIKTGTIRIQSAVNNQKTEICFWIDANHPVVNVEIKGDNAFSAQVMLEPWRISGAALHGGAAPDTVLPTEDNTILWYQRNTGSIFADTLKNQHLEKVMEKYQDPLKNLTFGCLISGAGLKSKDAKTLVTKEPVSNLLLRLHALTAQTGTPEEWIQQLKTQRAAVESLSFKGTLIKHEAYWADFWNKSWIFVSPRQESAERKISSLVPSNGLNFRVGEDTQGGSRFTGSMGRMTLLKRALSAAEIKKLAARGPTETGLNEVGVLYSGTPAPYTEIGKSATWTDSPQLTVEAWVNPSADNLGTRILDKSMPGKDDGFLLDTHPGNSLRLIIGQNSFGVPNCLKDGKWNHVAVWSRGCNLTLDIWPFLSRTGRSG